MAKKGRKGLNKVWKTWIPLLLVVAAGMGFLFLFSILFQQIGGTWSWSMLARIIVFLAVGMMISIHIHELGHCVMGTMFGYRLMSYRVGFLAWNYENGRMRFSVMRNRGYGGLCAMLPPEREPAIWQQALFFSGGLLANYLTALLAWTAGLLWLEHPGGRLFFFALGTASIFLAVTNTLPIHVGASPSDGSILWGLLLKKPGVDKMLALNRLTAQMSAGVRPRDLDLPRPWPWSQPYIYDLTLQVYRYFQVLDRKDFLEARIRIEEMERNLAQFPPHSLPSLYYELCFVSAVSGEVERARRYHRKAGRILERDQDVNGLRVKAFYAYYIEQEPEKALELARQGISVAHLFPLSGQAYMEKDLLANLIDTLQKEPISGSGH